MLDYAPVLTDVVRVLRVKLGQQAVALLVDLAGERSGHALMIGVVERTSRLLADPGARQLLLSDQGVLHLLGYNPDASGASFCVPLASLGPDALIPRARMTFGEVTRPLGEPELRVLAGHRITPFHRVGAKLVVLG